MEQDGTTGFKVIEGIAATSPFTHHSPAPPQIPSLSQKSEAASIISDLSIPPATDQSTISFSGFTLLLMKNN
jgi:hypothetical protein